MSQRAQQLLADLTAYIAGCEEANDLMDFAERSPVPIEWHPERGQSLRDALRDAKQRAEGQQP